MELVIATNNPGKLEEMQRLLEAAGHTALSLAQVGLVIEPPENGETFEDNALMKAAAVCKACGLPALGDDSGLAVDALDGAPGIHSARFAGRHGDDAANNKRLLFLLERMPYAARGAQFVCALALAMPGGMALCCKGVCHGSIGFAKSGDNGFGYDPLFYIGERSFADMEDEEKDKLSHRAKAMQQLLEELPAFLAAQENAPAP